LHCIFWLVFAHCVVAWSNYQVDSPIHALLSVGGSAGRKRKCLKERVEVRLTGRSKGRNDIDLCLCLFRQLFGKLSTRHRRPRRYTDERDILALRLVDYRSRLPLGSVPFSLSLDQNEGVDIPLCRIQEWKVRLLVLRFLFFSFISPLPRSVRASGSFLYLWPLWTFGGDSLGCSTGGFDFVLSFPIPRSNTIFFCALL
jgi:hypothetical protein